MSEEPLYVSYERGTPVFLMSEEPLYVCYERGTPVFVMSELPLYQAQRAFQAQEKAWEQCVEASVWRWGALQGHLAHKKQRPRRTLQ